MQQAAGRERWSAQDVDERLAAIMTDVYDRARDAGERYCGDPADYENGANAAAFLRVAEAVALGSSDRRAGRYAPGVHGARPPRPRSPSPS